MKQTRGYIALTAVLVLSALFLSIALGMASHAIATSQSGVAIRERDSARLFAESCVEYALMELVRTLNYGGDDSILIGDGSCDILPISREENGSRIVRTEGRVGPYTYRLHVIVQAVSPEVVIDSFERVASF